MNKEKILLGTGIAITVIYFLNLFVLAAMYPGYSHMSNWVSDLGRMEAPHHRIFNAVIGLLGILYLLTALGFFYSIKRVTEKKVLAILIGVSIAAFAINCFLGACYPLPDPRHGAYGIGILHFFTPFLLAWAFWRLIGSRIFTILQLLSFILIVTGFLIQMRAGGLVNEMNLGLVQRLHALIIFTWLTFTCYWLIKYKPKKIRNTSEASIQ